jgi:hypothetical protein
MKVSSSPEITHTLQRMFEKMLRKWPLSSMNYAKKLLPPFALESEPPTSTVDLLRVEQIAVGTYGHRNITLIVVTYLDIRLILRQPQKHKAR